MSIKIPLTVAESPDAELVDYGIIPYRILCPINFGYIDEKTIHHPTVAILDTGAPLSVIPKCIWQSSMHKILGSSYISGIVKGDTYKIKSEIGIITIILLDDKGRSHPLTIRAQFALTDEVPLLLGIHGFLEISDLHVSIRKNSSWVELKTY